MDELPALTHETLSASVYGALCEALMQGRFKPGDRLKIRELAARLQTSVTPVRDAVIRLVQDEALVFRSARDIRIPLIGRERYLEIRGIRLRLEGLAAEEAAARVSAAELEALRALLDANEAAMRAGDWLAALAANQAFHFELANIARMPVLSAMLQRLWLQMGPLIAQAYIAGGRAMIDHHYPVVEALRRRDPQGAAAAIQRDIIEGGGSILALLPAGP